MQAKHNGLEIKAGNLKIGEDTIIFNMGTAKRCPSKTLGFCAICEDCYAAKPEKIRPAVLPYRNRQKRYWLSHTAAQFFNDLSHILTTKRRRVNGKMVPLYQTIKYFRFNESGDFWSQKCVDKLDNISRQLWKVFRIKTYGYTARKDLNFKNAFFLVRGSSNTAGNAGEAIARSPEVLHELAHMGKYYENDKKYLVCLMDCKDCNYCKDTFENIVFPIH